MVHFKHENIVADLKELVLLLKKYNFESTNTMELYRIQNVIGRNKNSISYDYVTDDIIFNVSNSGMKAKPENQIISVIINSKYTLTSLLSSSIDIFSKYCMELYIKGYKDNNDKDNNIFKFFCWHLDREPNMDGNYKHPYYHFHAGGKKLNGIDLGGLLMINSPRIPHPPMDIVLSIHFVILNFLHTEDFKEQKKILFDDGYIGIVERAQKRILEPYFATFNGTRHSAYSPQNLFPLYV